MAELDPKLVEAITREVVEQLGRSAAPRQGGGTPAKVQPPAGVCTGDYSKFAELQGRKVGAAAPAPAAAPTASEATAAMAHEPVPLTGIITASQLHEAMAASPDGVAVLAADARLSPLANDLARQHPQKIRRAGIAGQGDRGRTPAADLAWMWWIDGHCPAVRQLVSRPDLPLRPSSEPHQHSALGRVIRDLASAIKARRVGGGLLFVHDAAMAMCLANRCPSIRAVLGTCGEAVEQGISQLGVNVLVIEYPHVGPKAMAAMVQRMLQQPANVPAAVQRLLAELERCG